MLKVHLTQGKILEQIEYEPLESESLWIWQG